MPWLAFTFAAGLALVHLFGGHLRFLAVVPRSRWLSGAGGVAVAYVFVHILPDLAASQETIRKALGEGLRFLEHHVYLLALLGLVVFYGLERLAKRSRRTHQAAGREATPSPGVFWIHIVSFTLYNALVGYLLLHREKPGRLSLIFFFLAMATHFLVNDYGLAQEYRERYERFGRWLLALAVLAGWSVGCVTSLHPALVALLFSFLAGGVILNVLKEELPEERQSAFWAFALGVLLYAVVLLVI